MCSTPGKNKLFFRNITEDKIESLLNGVFHNDIHAEDLVGQSGSGISECGTASVSWMNSRSLPIRKRIILSNCGCYDPESIEEYIARGGYRTFVKTIRNYTFSEVCNIIDKSGLRGGSGEVIIQGQNGKDALNTPASSRYLICNARESDPGAFTDRTILESDPHMGCLKGSL
ncbi:MAG: hypothetical protein U0T33_11170 [Bacteroidales bacterium]